MICTDCKTPMVSVRQAQAHGVPEGHKRHMGHGRCSTCIQRYRAAAKAAEAEVNRPLEAPPFDEARARADLIAWTRTRRRRLGHPLNIPVEGLDSYPVSG